MGEKNDQKEKQVYMWFTKIDEKGPKHLQIIIQGLETMLLI